LLPFQNKDLSNLSRFHLNTNSTIHAQNATHKRLKSSASLITRHQLILTIYSHTRYASFHYHVTSLNINCTRSDKLSKEHNPNYRNISTKTSLHITCPTAHSVNQISRTLLKHLKLCRSDCLLLKQMCITNNDPSPPFEIKRS
jgi:hypothetical protein